MTLWVAIPPTAHMANRPFKSSEARFPSNPSLSLGAHFVHPKSPASRSPFMVAAQAGAVMIRSKRPTHMRSWTMTPFSIKMSWAPTVLGMASKLYISPGMRTKSVAMKPTTANICDKISGNEVRKFVRNNRKNKNEISYDSNNTQQKICANVMHWDPKMRSKKTTTYSGSAVT